MANDDNNSAVGVGEDGGERLDVDFQPVERERIDNALRFSREVLEAAGATQVCWTGLVSTHVQGGCRMGDDPARSVVDRHGESHEVKRLFVGDGSLVPRTLSVNPSLTIMALATRLAEHLDADPNGYLGAKARERGRRRMRAALLSEYHRPLELVERPEPEPTGARSVVVEIVGAGVCATDLHAQDGLMEPAGLTLPVVLGHENAGRVHAVGDDVTAAAVGDAVLVHPAYSCGLCVPCRRGFDIHCERHQFTGLTRDGGFSEYVLVDERSLIRLPDGVDPAEVAPHADAGITAYHAVKKLLPRLAPGSTTAVIGVGGVGHIGLQLVRVLGAGGHRDRHGRAQAPARARARCRRGAGRQADVADAVREATNGAGADVVLDFVGTDATHESAMQMLARRRPLLHRRIRGHRHVPSVGFVVGETASPGTSSATGSICGSSSSSMSAGADHASNRDASPRGGERRARSAARRRGHRAGGPRPMTSVQERLFDVRDTRAVVTGAASGLGYAIAEVLADCGARVTLADVDAERLESVTAALVERGANARSHVVDVSDEGQVEALIADVVAAEGGLDVVFANAGIAATPGFAVEGGQRLDTVARSDWDKVLGVNLNGVLFTMKHAAAVMRRQGSGRIVVMSSNAGLRPEPVVCYGYAASKAAIINIVRQAALELAPHGVLVNAICPARSRGRGSAAA